MNNPFDDYLLLLEQMRVELSHLSELANAKISAVQKNDLIALDKVMKQEQASSMTFRGLEQKQTLLLRATELTDVPLSSLPEKYPPEKRLDAKNTVEKLQNQRYRAVPLTDSVILTAWTGSVLWGGHRQTD